jgi:hypothetical protein
MMLTIWWYLCFVSYLYKAGIVPAEEPPTNLPGRVLLEICSNYIEYGEKFVRCQTIYIQNLKSRFNCNYLGL